MAELKFDSKHTINIEANYGLGYSAFGATDFTLANFTSGNDLKLDIADGARATIPVSEALKNVNNQTNRRMITVTSKNEKAAGAVLIALTDEERANVTSYKKTAGGVELTLNDKTLTIKGQVEFKGGEPAADRAAEVKKPVEESKPVEIKKAEEKKPAANLPLASKATNLTPQSYNGVVDSSYIGFGSWKSVDLSIPNLGNHEVLTVNMSAESRARFDLAGALKNVKKQRTINVTSGPDGREEAGTVLVTLPDGASVEQTDKGFIITAANGKTLTVNGKVEFDGAVPGQTKATEKKPVEMQIPAPATPANPAAAPAEEKKFQPTDEKIGKRFADVLEYTAQKEAELRDEYKEKKAKWDDMQNYYENKIEKSYHIDASKPNPDRVEGLARQKAALPAIEEKKAAADRYAKIQAYLTKHQDGTDLPATTPEEKQIRSEALRLQEPAIAAKAAEEKKQAAERERKEQLNAPFVADKEVQKTAEEAAKMSVEVEAKKLGAAKEADPKPWVVKEKLEPWQQPADVKAYVNKLTADAVTKAQADPKRIGFTVDEAAALLKRRSEALKQEADSISNELSNNHTWRIMHNNPPKELGGKDNGHNNTYNDRQRNEYRELQKEANRMSALYSERGEINDLIARGDIVELNKLAISGKYPGLTALRANGIAEQEEEIVKAAESKRDEREHNKYYHTIRYVNTVVDHQYYYPDLNGNKDTDAAIKKLQEDTKLIKAMPEAMKQAGVAPGEEASYKEYYYKKNMITSGLGDAGQAAKIALRSDKQELLTAYLAAAETGGTDIAAVKKAMVKPLVEEIDAAIKYATSYVTVSAVNNEKTVEKFVKNVEALKKLDIKLPGEAADEFRKTFNAEKQKALVVLSEIEERKKAGEAHKDDEKQAKSMVKQLNMLEGALDTLDGMAGRAPKPREVTQVKADAKKAGDLLEDIIAGVEKVKKRFGTNSGITPPPAPTSEDLSYLIPSEGAAKLTATSGPKKNTAIGHS